MARSDGSRSGVRAGDLTGRVWLRSHEEETGPIRVYRPADHAFPPARGREGLRFDADGGFAYLGPGADDRPRADDGTWQAEPRDAAVITATVDDQVITMRILELSADILRLEWTNP